MTANEMQRILETKGLKIRATRTSYPMEYSLTVHASGELLATGSLETCANLAKDYVPTN